MSAHLSHTGSDSYRESDDPAVPDSRPAVGAFFLTKSVREQAMANVLGEAEVARTIVLTSERIRNAALEIAGFLPEGMYEKMDAKRRPTFERHGEMLKHTINVHDTGHQDRDGVGVMWLGELFPEKIKPELLEAVVAGSLIHDIAYMDAAERFVAAQIEKLKKDLRSPTIPQNPLFGALSKWMKFRDELSALKAGNVDMAKDAWDKGQFPKEVNKKALDPHAPMGQDVMETWFSDPEMAEVFAHWTLEQKEAAKVAIRDHSNGSEYDPFSTPLAAKLLRLFDKLDNTFERTVGMINKETLNDRMKHHRFVPTAIQSMHYELDKGEKKFFVHYNADPGVVQTAMYAYDKGFVYDKQRYLDDFELAYGEKSLPIAAEAIAALFAGDDELYEEAAELIVVHHFPDGSTVEKRYLREVAEPAFTES
jgi:hypothetical protein